MTEQYEDENGLIWTEIDCDCGAEGGCWKTEIEAKK